MPAPMPPDYVCREFERSPDSLIEEPECCENCAHYADGLCRRRDG